MCSNSLRSEELQPSSWRPAVRKTSAVKQLMGRVKDTNRSNCGSEACPSDERKMIFRRLEVYQRAMTNKPWDVIRHTTAATADRRRVLRTAERLPPSVQDLVQACRKLATAAGPRPGPLKNKPWTHSVKIPEQLRGRKRRFAHATVYRAQDPNSIRRAPIASSAVHC